MELDKETKYQIQSIILVNQDIRRKEREHDSTIKKLSGEIKGLRSINEEFLNLFKEIKISNENIMSKLESIEERLQAVEANRTGPFKKNGIIKIKVY